MKERIEFQPKAHLIQSLRSTDLQYNEGIPELVDNSIDKGAKRIEIKFDSRSLVVSDDGEGCSDLGLMLSYGGSNDTSGVALGRYGVGLKNTACAMASNLSIRSVKDGLRRSVQIDWDKTARDGFFADMETESTSDKNGTVIELVGLFKRLPPLTGLADDLERMFWPAIRSGVKILLDGQELSEIPWPDYSETHDCSASLGDGVSFRARGGIIRSGQTNKGSGPFIISYRHRVIDPECSGPIGDFMSSERFLCHVELFEAKKGQWELLKHKDGLRDSELRAALYAALEREYHPLLKKLSDEGEMVDIQQLASDLSHALDGIVRGRESRQSPSGSGSPNPTGEKPERLNASQTDGSGKCKPKTPFAPRNGFFLTFNHLNGQIGKVDVNKNRVQVSLNLNHPAIARWRKEKNSEQCLTVALSLLDSHQVIVGRENPEQLKLQIVEAGSAHQTFVKLLSEWLSSTRKPANT